MREAEGVRKDVEFARTSARKENEAAVASMAAATASALAASRGGGGWGGGGGAGQSTAPPSFAAAALFTPRQLQMGSTPATSRASSTWTRGMLSWHA